MRGREIFCATCGNCIRKCPGKAIFDKPVVHEDGRLSHVDGDRRISCTLCMKECSFNRSGYAKLKEIYKKNSGM